MDEAGVDRVVIVSPGLNDPQRLCARSRQALSQPLRSHGLHSAAGPRIGRAAAGMERSSRACSACALVFNTPATCPPGSPTAPPTGSGRKPRRLVFPSCSCGRRGSRLRPHRGAPPAAHAHHRPHGLELIEPYQQDHAISRRRLIRPLRSPNIPTSASSCRVRSAIRSNLIRSAT